MLVLRKPYFPIARKVWELRKAGGGAPPVTGLLQASFTVQAVLTTNDLTALGTIDWAQYETADGSVTNRKSGGPNLIGAMSSAGDVLNSTTDFGYNVSWTDGTPTVAATHLNALYVSSTARNVGPAKALAAGTTLQRAKIPCGCYNGRMFLQASLSDGSAAALVDWDTGCVAPNTNVVAGILDLQWRAASNGQTLNFILGMDSAGAFSNTGIQAICLY